MNDNIEQMEDGDIVRAISRMSTAALDVAHRLLARAEERAAGWAAAEQLDA